MNKGMSLERLRSEGERFQVELSREYYESLSGLKGDARIGEIYEAHAALFKQDAFDVAHEAFSGSAEGSEEHRSASILLDWQIEAKSSRELATLDERILAWESTAVAQLADGRAIPYERIAIDSSNSLDRAERAMMESARAALVSRELAPMKRERLQRERDVTESIGAGDGYIHSWERLSGISLGGLRAECEQFLRDTQAMWDDVAPSFTKRVLGMKLRECSRSDSAALLRAREFDKHFPARDMESSVRRQVSEMGIDPEANGRIIFDTGERPGKRARAFCSPVRVPEEVYLVLRPHGGQTDWNTLLHELGHALHFAYMRPDLPMEYRFMGDNSITEGFAMLFDHLMQDAGWLTRYTGLDNGTAPEFLRTIGFEELHFLRRYSAKLIYEYELYSGSVSWDSLPDLYVSLLTGAVDFRYDPADAFVDVDPRFYSARYLRAWQYQSLLTETLVDRYDADWWRNPRCGPWIVNALLAEGQRELAHEQAERVSSAKLSFVPLVRSIEKLLA